MSLQKCWAYAIPELLASMRMERNMEMVFFINPQKYEKSLNKKVIYALNLKTNQQKGSEMQFQTPVVSKIFFDFRLSYFRLYPATL